MTAKEEKLLKTKSKRELAKLREVKLLLALKENLKYTLNRDNVDEESDRLMTGFAWRIFFITRREDRTRDILAHAVNQALIVLRRYATQKP